MREDRAEWQRRVSNRVTVIKLAIQLLERRADLPPQQRGLVRTAVQASDALIADLVEQWEAERRGSAAEPAPTRSTDGPSRAARSGRTA